MNHFAYADDLVVLAPSATGLNSLLRIREEFAVNLVIIFNTSKSVCMALYPGSMSQNVSPNIYLSGAVIEYVKEFRYLGHIISVDFKDDSDIRREIRSLYARGNTLIRKLNFLPIDVKCSLFKSYCYSLYTSSLWCRYNKYTLDRLKVCYNNMMRGLAGVARWQSASSMFATLGVRSFGETMRVTSYSLMCRVNRSENSLVRNLVKSDSYCISALRDQWTNTLF